MECYKFPISQKYGPIYPQGKFEFEPKICIKGRYRDRFVRLWIEGDEERLQQLSRRVGEPVPDVAAERAHLLFAGDRVSLEKIQKNIFVAVTLISEDIIKLT